MQLRSSLQQHTSQLWCFRARVSGLHIKKYSILHQLLHTDQISLLERKKLSYYNLNQQIFQKCTNSTKFKAVPKERIHVNDPTFPEFPIFEQKSLELKTLWNIFENLMLSRPVQKILVL